MGLVFGRNGTISRYPLWRFVWLARSEDLIELSIAKWNRYFCHAMQQAFHAGKKWVNLSEPGSHSRCAYQSMHIIGTGELVNKSLMSYLGAAPSLNYLSQFNAIFNSSNELLLERKKEPYTHTHTTISISRSECRQRERGREITFEIPWK